YVDLSTHRLTEPERTPLFLNRKAALAHRSSNKRAEDLAIAAHPVVIEQGSQILWDGKPWRIAVGQTELTLVCAEGTPIPLARSAFESLVKEGRIVGVPTATKSSITEAGEALLDQAREVDLTTATFRNRA